MCSSLHLCVCPSLHLPPLLQAEPFHCVVPQAFNYFIQRILESLIYQDPELNLILLDADRKWQNSLRNSFSLSKVQVPRIAFTISAQFFRLTYRTILCGIIVVDLKKNSLYF